MNLLFDPTVHHSSSLQNYGVEGKEVIPEESVYPDPNFPLEEHKEVNANNRMNLIFDATARHSSSIQNCEVEDEEVIPEEGIH